MSFDAWMLNAMEEYGYTDTNDGLINRVAVEIQRMHPKRRERGFMPSFAVYAAAAAWTPRRSRREILRSWREG